MKKSSQSLKNIKKSKPNKKLTGKNFEEHKHTSNIEDPEIMAAMIDLAMRDSDLKREAKNFSLEYVEILKGRLRLYFKNFHTTRSVGSDFPDKWEENINRGLFKEIEFLKNEQLAFDEKHKVSLEDSIKKAKKGESRSILRLVKWDKGWAAQDFIQNIQQVEVYKGSSGAHFGPSAIAGAINFITGIDYINSYSINGFNGKNNSLAGNYTKITDNNWHLNFKGSSTISETDSAIAIYQA